MSTVTGSCHCGAVAFEARLADAVETSRCNCSICTKTRFWKTLVPSDAFTLTRGKDALLSYRFGSEHVDHRTCGTCGTKVFGTVTVDGTRLVAVSVPCLDLDAGALARLPVAFEDGRKDAHDETPDVTSYL